MKKLLLILLLFTGLTGFKTAQNHQITGTVYAKDDGQPIPGVVVKIKGTNTGVQTNTNGKYAINAPMTGTLVFSAIGYSAKEVTIGKQDKIDVYLETSSQQLGEVVVTGYGVKRGTAKTGSVTTVDVANAKKMDANASAQLLQGQAGGVVVNSSGAPGGQAVVSSDKSLFMHKGKMVPKTVNKPSPVQFKAPSPNTDESYKGIVENEFNDTKANPLSTFSVDVDAASYSNVRRFINKGELPPPDAVRIEEMVNYFKYDLAGPTNNEPVAIHTELSSTPWNTKHRLLRIGLKAKTIDTDKLPPSNLVFLIDVSGSMNMPDKLPLVKASMQLLTAQLRAKDKVAIVTYAGEAGVALEATPGNQKDKILNAIEGLNANGSTNGAGGIKMAYQIAKQNFMPKGNNRIIMATDGDFNVGPNSDEDMEQLIVKQRESKVAISIMGFGMGNLKDSKMETLADKGNGNYAYIDNLTEAHKAFVTEFGGTLFTVAKDVKIQVEFNPAKVQAYRLLGYEDRMLNKEDFNNDRKDAGDMGSGHTVTALYEIIPAGIKDDFVGSVDPLKYQKTAPSSTENKSDEMATIKFRYKQNDSETSKMEMVTIKDAPKDFNATTADLRFAAAVAEFGMLLRNSQFKQHATFEQAISIAKGAKGKDEEGYRSEFVRLAESAKVLSANNLAAND